MSSVSVSVPSFVVKREWQELSEEDRTDISKFDKYLNDLLAQEKVPQSNYELIIDYIMGKAHLCKFIVMRLNSQSSSKSRNKMRILFLINKILLEKDSQKKIVIVEYLEEYLCPIYVNIFKEYVDDISTTDKFKMMRLCWVQKLSAHTIEKIRKEIGDLFYLDIDVGLSHDSIQKIQKYYKIHNIDPNLYLKKALEDLEKQQKKKQPSDSTPKLSMTGTTSTFSMISTTPIVTNVHKSSLQPKTEEKKKNLLLKPKALVSSQESAQRSSLQEESPFMNSREIHQNNQKISAKKEDTTHAELDIQIKKKIKKAIMPNSTQSQLSSAQPIKGTTPSKVIPTDMFLTGSSPQKKLKTSKVETYPLQQTPNKESGQLTPTVKDQLTSAQKIQLKQAQLEKAHKITEQSKSNKNQNGFQMIPTTPSLDYGVFPSKTASLITSEPSQSQNNPTHFTNPTKNVSNPKISSQLANQTNNQTLSEFKPPHTKQTHSQGQLIQPPPPPHHQVLHSQQPSHHQQLPSQQSHPQPLPSQSSNSQAQPPQSLQGQLPSQSLNAQSFPLQPQHNQTQPLSQSMPPQSPHIQPPNPQVQMQNPALHPQQHPQTPYILGPHIQSPHQQHISQELQNPAQHMSNMPMNSITNSGRPRESMSNQLFGHPNKPSEMTQQGGIIRGRVHQGNQQFQPPPPPPQFYAQQSSLDYPQAPSSNDIELRRLSAQQQVYSQSQNQSQDIGRSNQSNKTLAIGSVNENVPALFFELFEFVKPTISSRHMFLAHIERMKLNKETYINPQLFLNRKYSSHSYFQYTLSINSSQQLHFHFILSLCSKHFLLLSIHQSPLSFKFSKNPRICCLSVAINESSSISPTSSSSFISHYILLLILVRILSKFLRALSMIICPISVHIVESDFLQETILETTSKITPKKTSRILKQKENEKKKRKIDKYSSKLTLILILYIQNSNYLTDQIILIIFYKFTKFVETFHFSKREYTR